MMPSPRIRPSLVALLFGPILALSACGRDAPAVQPVPVDGPSPFHYPVTLWDQGVQGEVVLMVRVSATGAVDSAVVSRSSGRPAFDAAALGGARGLHFLPGHSGGKTLPMWVRVPVRFARDSAAVDSAG